MLLRSTLSRIHKYQFLNNFTSLANVGSSETAVSSSKLKPFSSEEKAQEKVNVVSYLINSCGLSPEKAISSSKKVHFDSPQKPDAVISLFAEYGFSKSQIAKLVTRRPLLLVSNPEKILRPKIEFFLQLKGVKKADLLRIIVRDPTLLTKSLENQLLPIYNYLKDILGAERVGTLMRRGPWIFYQSFVKKTNSNVDFLQALGVPSSCIFLLFSNFPGAISQKHDKFKEDVAKVKEMGFDPSKSAFVLAVDALHTEGRKALWYNCYGTYTKFGWTNDDIYMAFKKHPHCMLLSEKKISGIMSFLVNKMGREPRMIARYPQVLLYSLEKRIIPRCSVVRHLCLKGLLKEDKSLCTILCPGEKEFLKKFVTKYAEEVPQLYDMYKGKTRFPEV